MATCLDRGVWTWDGMDACGGWFYEPLLASGGEIYHREGDVREASRRNTVEPSRYGLTVFIYLFRVAWPPVVQSSPVAWRRIGVCATHAVPAAFTCHRQCGAYPYMHGVQRGTSCTEERNVLLSLLTVCPVASCASAPPPVASWHPRR
jgi:hypothetical protein